MKGSVNERSNSLIGQRERSVGERAGAAAVVGRGGGVQQRKGAEENRMHQHNQNIQREREGRRGRGASEAIESTQLCALIDAVSTRLKPLSLD